MIPRTCELEKRVIDLEKRCELVSGKNHIYSNQCLSTNYKVSTLVKLSERASFLNSTQYLDTRAKKEIEQLIKDAEKDGMCLVVTSGYRSKETQKKLFEESTKENKLQSIALPGRSEHQTGLAVDFAGCPMKDGERDDSVERPELKQFFGFLPEYEWLKENASKYGLEESFRYDNMEETGYIVEPWHWKIIIN